MQERNGFMKKVYEATKGEGENKVVQRFTVSSKKDNRIIENFVYCGWQVKEIKEGE